jgi:hypothetical protein
MSSQMPQTIANVREVATDIVVGVFQGYGPPRWNTPDGHRPTTEEVQQTSVVIEHPLSIDLVSELRGDGAAAQHAIAAGGSIGCDRVSFDNDMPLLAEQRYLFFMLPVNDSVGQLSGNFLVFGAWPVGDGDIVETAHEGPMPLAEVRIAIEGGPKPSVPPSPGEPESAPWLNAGLVPPSQADQSHCPRRITRLTASSSSSSTRSAR